MPDSLPPDLPETLETQRLTLRVPLPGDGPALNEALLETWEEVHRWLPWARELPSVADSEEKVREWRAKLVARTALPMVMVHRESQRLIGTTGLHAFDWSVPKVATGYWVRRTFQGQGYVTEAVRALSRLAFTTLGAERVEIHCSHRNHRSQKVAERCGFVLEARLRNEAREPTGELRDTLIYALVRQDAAVEALVAGDRSSATL